MSHGNFELNGQGGCYETNKSTNNLVLIMIKQIVCCLISSVLFVLNNKTVSHNVSHFMTHADLILSLTEPYFLTQLYYF